MLNGVKLYSVTDVLEAQGLSDYSKVNDEVLKVSCAFGTNAHTTIKLYLRGNLDESTLDPALRPYLDGAIKFCNDYHFIPIKIEQSVYSKLWKICGTPDCIGLMDKMAVIDWKSSTSIIPATAIQLAGYELIENEWRNSKMKIKQRVSVLLTGDGKYKPTFYKDTSDITQFQSAVNNYLWRVKHNLIKRG
jgi:hypothetical protein